MKYAFLLLKPLFVASPFASGAGSPRNDFVESDGSLPVAGAEEIIPTINKLVNEWLVLHGHPSDIVVHIHIYIQLYIVIHSDT